MHFLQHGQAHTAREFIHNFVCQWLTWNQERWRVSTPQSTLTYVHGLATRHHHHHVPTVITFDQRQYIYSNVSLFWRVCCDISKQLIFAHASTYGVIHNNDGNSLCSSLLTKNVISSKAFVKPGKLPSTSCAMKYHSLRTYLQVVTWMRNEVMRK